MNRCDNDCWTENPLAQVRLLYTELAQHPEKDFGWAKGKKCTHAGLCWGVAESVAG